MNECILYLSKGIKQGNDLLPLLFIVVSKYLRKHWMTMALKTV